MAIQARIKLGEFNLSPEQVDKASFFAEILHRENEIQNLTRILGVEEFIDGHLIDVIHLFEMDLLSSRVLDLGSGCGVPGLLAAAIDLDQSREWALCDSEKQKCEFLFATAKELEMQQPLAFKAVYLSFLGKERGPKAGALLSYLERDFVIDRIKNVVGFLEKMPTISR